MRSIDNQEFQAYRSRSRWATVADWFPETHQESAPTGVFTAWQHEGTRESEAWTDPEWLQWLAKAETKSKLRSKQRHERLAALSLRLFVCCVCESTKESRCQTNGSYLACPKCGRVSYHRAADPIRKCPIREPDYQI